MSIAANSTETKRAPLDKIKDVDLLPLLKSKQVIMWMDVVKSKKAGGSDLYSQELRWADTNQPLLTKTGVIDCKGTIIWGPGMPDKRNTGEYGKPNGDFDECDIQFSTKGSGSFGELMHYYNDYTWKEGVRAFAAREKSLDGYTMDPSDFCRKTTGTKKVPATAEQKAAYTAAGDFGFTIKLKIQKRTKTGEIANIPFLWKLTKYVLDKRGMPMLQEIKVNSQNVRDELPKGSVVSLAMRLGNCTRKDATVIGQQICTMYAAFNVGVITMIKKGDNSGAMNVDRTPEEIRAMLAAEGIELEYDDGSAKKAAEESNGDDPVMVDPATLSGAAVGSTGEDLTKQFSSLGV